MLKRLLCAAVITFCFALPAKAFDGNAVTKLCAHSKELCKTYVDGIVTPLFAFATNHSCLPKRATIPQVSDIVLEYIKATPEKRHEPVPFLFDDAMKKAFNCPPFYLAAFNFFKKGFNN